MTELSSGFGGPRHYHEGLGPVLFQPYAAELAHRLPADPGGAVLEVACGTGIGTAALRRRLDGRYRLVATDLSPAMLDFAQTELAGRPGIEWQVADAAQLPFGDASFAGVVCGFGYMFPPDRQAALREARRVLQDGGLLVFSVWDRIEDNLHARVAAEVLEGMFPDDPQMRFRAPYEMHEPALLHQLLGAAGFAPPRIETVRVPIAAADPRAIATGQIRGTPRSALIVQHGVALEDAIEQVAQALIRAGGNPYRAHAQAVLVRARAA